MFGRDGPSIIQKIRYYYNQRDLLLSYVRKDLRERYIGSVFGFYWSVINPLILLAIYTFVFSIIFKVRYSNGTGLTDSALYIFSGMSPWLAFHESIGRSTNILIDNANLIKKVMFPSKILPMYIVISHLVNLAIGFSILVVAIVISGVGIKPVSLLLPLYVMAQFILTLGICWGVSAANVFIRDIAQLTNQFMLIWMYLSPIFYTVENIPESFRKLAYINPIAHLIEGYRDILLRGVTPDFKGLLYFYAFAILVCVAGYLFFTRNQHAFADAL